MFWREFMSLEVAKGYHGFQSIVNRFSHFWEYRRLDCLFAKQATLSKSCPTCGSPMDLQRRSDIQDKYKYIKSNIIFIKV